MALTQSMADEYTTRKSILVHYAEIGLKGKNQPVFRRQLRSNIREKLASLDCHWKIEDAGGLLVIHPPANATEEQFAQAIAGLKEVFGVAWLTAGTKVPHRRFSPESHDRDFEALQSVLLDTARRAHAPEKAFAVRVNRGEKRLPFTSPELERILGGYIQQNVPWPKVRLSRPDVTFHLDFRKDAAFVFTDKLKGPGGLPVGTAGRVLALLSGGIDSPAAIFLMARRGCNVDFIHFTATTMQQDQAREYKVWKLAQALARHTGRARLFLVPYVHFDLALMREPVPFDLILFRRFMLRVAQRLAGTLGAQGLVTGDNLSQVASQTLPNLVSASQAVNLPVFRPLIGFDKEEIIDLARRIGTFDISIQPYKDCCALIARHPRTRSRHEELSEIETRAFPDYEQMVGQTLAEAVCLE